MEQTNLFHEQEVERLIEGKEICHECGRRKRAYAKTMDRRLVAILLKVADHCQARKTNEFDIKDIFGDSQIMTADFRKLHYWNLVEHADRVLWYRITRDGWKFILGNLRVPKVLHIWKDKPITRSENTVAIFEAEPRWQSMKSDYTLDYLPWPFMKPTKETVL